MTFPGRRRAINRRLCLWAAGAALLGSARAGEAAGVGAGDGARLVVLDWGLTQTVLALGLVPLGVPAPLWYDRYAVTPILPHGVEDVGLLFTPNFELIQELAPATIIVTPALGPALPMLRRIAPTEPFSVFAPGPALYARMRRETERLADFLGCRPSFIDLDRRTESGLSAAGAALSRYDGRPLYLVSLLDERHVTVHGPGSLHDAVLAPLRLRNAWTGTAAGGSVTIPLEALTAEREARLVIIRGPEGDGPNPRILASPFWRALPFVRQGRVHETATVMPFGGLPSIARFAALLAAALNEPETPL